MMNPRSLRSARLRKGLTSRRQRLDALVGSCCARRRGCGAARNFCFGHPVNILRRQFKAVLQGPVEQLSYLFWRRVNVLIVATFFLFQPVFVNAGDGPKSKQNARSSGTIGGSDSSGSVAASPTLVDPAYLIGYSDVLHISVWREPELTTTAGVRDDGMISIPLVNDIQAEGLTPMQLAAVLREKLKAYVEDPRVTVAVSQMTPKRFYVVGEVSRHGPMTLLPDMTVFQALVTAGLTQFANQKKIYVMRTVDGKQEKFLVNYRQLIKGKRMEQNIKLRSGDTIVVP